MKGKTLLILGALVGGTGILIYFLTRKPANPPPTDKGMVQPCPVGSLGDIDNDGWVTEGGDFELARKFWLGELVPTDEELRRADWDGCGFVTMWDVLDIWNYLLYGVYPN